MTERQIENRVRKLQALEEQKKALEEQAAAIKAELQTDLEDKGVDELQTMNFVIRWKAVVTSRLDGKAFKAAFPEMYSQFTRQSTCKRFTIA